jgi:putative endonuclease
MTTTSPQERLNAHNTGEFDSNFSAKGIPWVLKTFIECQSLTQALKIEKFIKKMKSKVFIEKVITEQTLRIELYRKFE